MNNWIKIILRFLLLSVIDVFLVYYFTFVSSTIAWKITKVYETHILLEYAIGLISVTILTFLIYLLSGIKKGELFPDVLIIVFNGLVLIIYFLWLLQYIF